MPLPKIERRVLPFMDGADYLGPEFNGETYRLKFMRGGRVIWVDVDAAHRPHPAPLEAVAAIRSRRLTFRARSPASFPHRNRSAIRGLKRG